ncbi:MAG TPA: phosphopantothenoylcysteine decarboxylase, partial [Chloroflexota bacterium]
LDRGARVTLVSAPTALRPPGSAEFVPVLTAEEMRDSVMAKLPHVNVLIMAAAVADFRVDHRADQKVKRGEKSFQLSLVPNPDILAEAGSAPEGRAVLKVGFAAESEDLVARAREKLTRKRLDMIVANRVDAEGTVFGNDLNEVTIIDSSGSEVEVKRAPKTEIAHEVLDHVARLARERGLKGTSPRMRR